MKYEGVSYSPADLSPEWTVVHVHTIEEMDERLDTIQSDLGCNAVIISAGRWHEDSLILCGQLAIEKGFDRIYIQPRYIHSTVDETIERVGKFASKVKSLWETSDAIVYSIGHEYSLETKGIVPGNNWYDRLNFMTRSQWCSRVQAVLPGLFSRLLHVCKEKYGYEFAYSAIAECEVGLVPWSDTAFESIGIDAHIQGGSGWTENWVIDLLTRMKRLNKPLLKTVQDVTLHTFSFN